MNWITLAFLPIKNGYEAYSWVHVPAWPPSWFPLDGFGSDAPSSDGAYQYLRQGHGNGTFSPLIRNSSPLDLLIGCCGRKERARDLWDDQLRRQREWRSTGKPRSYPRRSSGSYLLRNAWFVSEHKVPKPQFATCSDKNLPICSTTEAGRYWLAARKISLIVQFIGINTDHAPYLRDPRDRIGSRARPNVTWRSLGVARNYPIQFRPPALTPGFRPTGSERKIPVCTDRSFRGQEKVHLVRINHSSREVAINYHPKLPPWGLVPFTIFINECRNWERTAFNNL